MKVVIVNCFETMEHRADLLCHYFLKRGAEVTVFTSDFLHMKKQTRTIVKEHYTVVPVRRYRKNLSVDRMRSHMEFAKEVYSRVRSMDIDLLWVCVPPNSNVKEMKKYKENHAAKLVFDVFDLWPETMPVPEAMKKLLPFKLWAARRDKYLDRADLLVTECRLFQELLKNDIPEEKREVLYLAREYAPFPEERERSAEREEASAGGGNPEKSELTLCYLGSVNNIIDIDVICRILTELSAAKPVALHIIGGGEKAEELVARAKETGALVTDHGILYDRAEKTKIFSLCDYGLNIMKESVTVGLTMKSMDYFEAGLPIINNIKGDTWDFCEEYGIGVNFAEENWQKKVLDCDISPRKVYEFGKSMFSLERFEEKMDELCQNLLGE